MAMRPEAPRGVSVACTFCLWEGLLEEAEAIAARLPSVELTDKDISEEDVREFCRMKYRAAVALSIGLMSLECLINEYLIQKGSRSARGSRPYQKLRQPKLESKVRAACYWMLRDPAEKKILKKIMEEIVPMRDFLLELKSIPYNFDLSVLTKRGGKALSKEARAFSNLNSSFVLDSVHAIRSLADILSTTRVGMPKPMIFLRLGAKPTV